MMTKYGRAKYGRIEWMFDTEEEMRQSEFYDDLTSEEKQQSVRYWKHKRERKRYNMFEHMCAFLLLVALNVAVLGAYLDWDFPKHTVVILCMCSLIFAAVYSFWGSRISNQEMQQQKDFSARLWAMIQREAEEDMTKDINWARDAREEDGEDE